MLPVMEIIMPQQALGNVPAFLAKLWKMVDNPETDELISWSDEGTSFIIKNQPEFARSLLPYYYKHSNMASFVRQLNMYGFHKVMSVESGGLKGDRDEIEFAHLYFLRGQEHLLDQIKRKVSSAPKSGGIPQQYMPSIKSEKIIITHQPAPEVGHREELVNEFLCEVGQLKDRQEDLDGKLDTMRNENEALWGEVLSLRQKHGQQQKIVNKLIQFLVALVQPRMGTGMKRRFRHGVQGLQLAIEEGSPNAKEPRIESPEESPMIQEIPEELTGAQLSDLLSKVPVGSVHEITVSNPPYSAERPPRTPQMNSVVMEPSDSPETSLSQSKYRMVDPASVNPSLRQMKEETDLTPKKRPGLTRDISKEDFDLDISSMQKELDNLKEILSGQITLDTSLVSNLFTAEQDNINCMNLFNENLLNQEEEADLEQASGDLKLVTYNPSLFELADEQCNGIGIDDDDLMHTPPKSTFEMELHTPNIQDSQDSIRQFFVK